MSREVFTVILAANFKKNVDQGWSILIECMEKPWKHGSVYRGRWRVFCLSPDKEEKPILVMRKNIEPRIFLSAHGVIAFLEEMGVEMAVAPMVEGQKVAVNKDLQVELVGDDE